MNNSVSLCHPDDEKSCSVCCGLFNHTSISQEFLAGFLDEGAQRVNQPLEQDRYKVIECRDDTAYICPFQGFVSHEQPGCLLHPLVSEQDTRYRSLYGIKICDDFFCPAHKLFPDELKDLLVRKVHHWYPYSVAIADPLFFIELVNMLRDRGIEMTDELLDSCLRLHARELDIQGKPVFSYAVPELDRERDYRGEVEGILDDVLTNG